MEAFSFYTEKGVQVCHNPDKGNDMRLTLPFIVTCFYRHIAVFALIPASLILAMLFSGFGSPDQQIDETDTQAVRKANFMFNFCKYTSGWPAGRKDGTFNIGILGSKPLYDELVEKYANKLIGSQPLRVSMMTKPESAPEYHMVYISKENKQHLAKFAKAAEKNKVITVCDFNGAMEAGAMFNFVVVENAIRYELNESAALQVGLMPAEKIKSWAVRLK